MTAYLLLVMPRPTFEDFYWQTETKKKASATSSSDLHQLSLKSSHTKQSLFLSQLLHSCCFPIVRITRIEVLLYFLLWTHIYSKLKTLQVLVSRNLSNMIPSLQYYYKVVSLKLPQVLPFYNWIMFLSTAMYGLEYYFEQLHLNRNQRSNLNLNVVAAKIRVAGILIIIPMAHWT